MAARTVPPGESHSPGGACVVCGKATDTRCSTCSSAGLDWMYFCSKEHQKLIWKLHKRVCGKNPFQWPSLSDRDKAEMWDLRNSPAKPGSEETWLNDMFMFGALQCLAVPDNRSDREAFFQARLVRYRTI
ncbi:hypothetical protein JCM3766R1_000582 [Sporobolomyces carnicolor]